MGKKNIPDRWLPYSPMGSIVPGTRFIACKVPLKDGLLQCLPEKERFGPKNLIETFPNIGLLIDLTNTNRYYSKEEFTNKNIQYEKIYCPGHVVPPNSIVKQFNRVVDGYLTHEQDPDTVIAVHCTHGVNRTGYFICRYMIERLKMSPEEALRNFQKARGHGIERQNYVSDLKNGCKGGNEANLTLVHDRNRGSGQTWNNKQHMTNYNSHFQRDRSNRYGSSYGNNQKKNDKHSYVNRQSSGFYQRRNRFADFGGQRYPEGESNYSYNWRSRGQSQSTSATSSNLIFQFTAAPGQVYNQPQDPHTGISIGGARYSQGSHFTDPPTKRFSEAEHRGFNPITKFCHPATTDEAACSSRLAGPSIAFQGKDSLVPGRRSTSKSEYLDHSKTTSSSGGRRGQGKRRWNGPQRGHHS